MDGITTGNGSSTGGIYAELLQEADKNGTRESLGDADTIQVPEYYKKEAIIYLPLKYGLVRFKELCDGTMTMSEFYKAKKEAEFFEWVEEQQAKRMRKQNDEVEYFD